MSDSAMTGLTFPGMMELPGCTSDSAPAQGDLGELLLGAAQAAHGALGLAGVARELLPQPDGRRVLQVGAPRLHDAPELPGFRFQRGLEALERRDEPPLDAFKGGEVY